MKAPKEILDTWKLQREFGDVQLIHEATRISRNTITNALNNGRMNIETFNALKKYFSEKRKAEKKLIADALK